MRKISSYAILFILLLASNVNAQKVDTMEINGEQYFVYPFKLSVSTHRDYYRVIDIESTIDFSFKQYRKEIEKQFGADMNKKEFKKLMKSYGKLQKMDDRKYLNGKFKKAARKNPYPLLEQKYNLSTDIVPSLDPIPDGKYVQLFEDFCITDAKGKCLPAEKIVAGYFSIKNNMLHGDAYWLNIKGDTLKSGRFENGLKVGEWRLEMRRVEYTISADGAKHYIDLGYPIADTGVLYTYYQNGAKTGYFKNYLSSQYPIEEGEYKEGDRVGEWIYRDITYTGRGKKKKRVRENELITMRYTLASSDTLVVKKPWIRSGLEDTYDADYEVFDFETNKYELLDPPSDLYSIAFEKEPDLDMEEEAHGSYETDEYIDDYYYEMDEYGEYGYSYEYSFYQPTVYDKQREKTFKRGYVIDSIGMIANYEGIYERYYPNGQLAFRYQFENGALVAEDTIFWDNGKPHDVIIYIADSNQYQRSVYDYSGKLYRQYSLDSLGDHIRVDYEYENIQYVYLDGFKAENPEYGDFYFYNHYDTLESELLEPLVVFKSWYKEDSSLLFNTYFDPNERYLLRHQHSVTGKPSTVSHKTFSETYESWTGKDSTSVGPIMLVTTASGALYDDEYYHDSVPQNNANFPYSRYDVAYEYLLMKNNEPYSGPVSINFNKGSFSISKKDMTINLPRASKKQIDAMEKKIKKYRKSGKYEDDIILNYIDASDYDRSIASYFYTDIFNQMLDQTFDYPEDYYDYGYEGEYYEEDYGKQKKSKYPEVQCIKGYMLNGKPHGTWTSYDQYKNVMSELPFENGEPSGRYKHFAYEYPKNVDDEYYYGWDENPLLDSFPKKKVYYLSYEAEYLNGMMDGKAVSYEWYGDVISETNYKEGLRSGPAFERNKLAITKMNYDQNVLDGYMQTYLTLKDKDSMLLYDLNFQDGLLQGESKSYHLNGKLSKKGFFLNGDPIDDYEAYDSLGFRYHYVKFKYSFPVEEKLWEENELSVRYLFNWEDSIIFEPSDITSSQSLEQMLYELGFGGDYLDQPYYGRPTLVNKRGVKYHMTKYYPNDTIARDGALDKGKKVGCWKFYNYEGEKLYEVEYFDTILVLNDSISFKAKGILTELDPEGETLYEAYIIEKFEKYDCSHTDHYEIRQFYTIWESNDSLKRMNGYVKNYYDNGVLQSEGEYKDGLPTGFWKYYDPFGKLNQYGQYVLGKRDGRWLSGDLSKTKYLGDICLNPNLPDLEKEIKYRENLLDITITNFKLGKSLNKQFYDINMNRFIDADEEDEGEEVEETEELEESIEEESH